jgi:hypothetical protein
VYVTQVGGKGEGKGIVIKGIDGEEEVVFLLIEPKLRPGIQEVVEQMVREEDGKGVDEQDAVRPETEEVKGIVLINSVHTCSGGGTALLPEAGEQRSEGVDEARRGKRTGAEGIEVGRDMEEEDDLALTGGVGKETRVRVGEEESHELLFLRFVKEGPGDKGVRGVRGEDM